MNEMEMFASDVHLWALQGLIRHHTTAAVEDAVWNEIKTPVERGANRHPINTGVFTALRDQCDG